MAARVNVKFVVILSAVLVVVFVGVAGAFYVIQSRSGANYARQGDAALARGDIKAADNFYSRAVGKERTNVEWLLKWRDIRAQKIPESYSSYLDDYRMYSGGILRSLALVQRTNLQAHKDYLQDLYNSGSLSAVVEETNAALRFFDPERPPALRRFRGMALARLYASGIDFAEPDKFKIPLAKEDLEAALAENPRDADAAECLALWYTTSASKAKATLDNAAAARNSQAAFKVMDDLVAANPGDPSSLALKLGQDVAAVENLEDPGNNPANLVRRKAAALEALRPRLGEVHRAYMAADPEKLTNLDIARFQVVAVRIDPKDGPALVGQVNDRALTKAPTNADLLARRAELAYMSGDLEGTIAILQTIIDLPRRPVSLDGLRLFDIRRRAIFAQTNAALALALKAPDQAATKAAVARAQTFRQKLALEVPEQSPELLFVDGKRLFIEGDLRGAQRTLTEFVRAPANLTNNLIEARLFLADAAVKLNETGIAREQLLQVLKQSPDSTEVLLSLAQVESTLQNRERAVEYLKRALDIDPDNQRARTNLEMLQAVSPGAGKLDDPVLQRIAEAQRIAQGTSNTIGNDAAAIEWLAKGLDANDHDPRLVSRVAEGKASLSDLDGAIAVLRAGLAKHPGDELLTAMLKRYEAAGTLEGTIALIDESGLSPVNKWLNKRQAYLARGKTAEAADALAQAAKAAPEDPLVLDLLFGEAAARKDIAEATRLAEVAARTDADRADGDIFKARLLILQSNDREAANTLRRATERGNANQAVYRLLGSVQLKLGNGADALKSFRRALELNPSDVPTIKSLLAALVQLGHIPEALVVAQTSEAYGRRDTEFVNAWLSLEAAAGNTQFARERREDRLRQAPDDMGNAAALAELYLTAREWAKARTLIDTLRAQDPSIRYVALDARWHADQGDLEKAAQTFVNYISTLAAKPEPMTPEPYLVFGQFMLQRGQSQTGLNAYRQAARFQDPKTLDVDVLIGDTQFSLGMIADAEQTYGRVIAAGVPDPDNRIHKRRIDCLLQVGRSADAEKEIAALGPAADSDPGLLVQRSVAASGLGEPKRARELLDRAIAKFPDEPSPYFFRARLLLSNPALASDALADLATVIRLQPGHWQALRTRSRIALSQNRPDDAILDLRAAVEANPQIDALRFELIDLLLKQNREGDALDLADAAIKARAGDPSYTVRVAERFSQSGNWARAAQYHKLVWEKLGTPAAAMSYVNALLSMTPPALAEASATLATRGLGVENSIDLLLARAAVRRKQKDNAAATTDALVALSLVTDLASLAQWNDRVSRVFSEPADAITLMTAAKPPPALTDWFALFKATFKLREPAQQSQGLADLQALAAPDKDKALRIAAYQTISGVLGEQGKFVEAFDATKAGLEIAPDDVILNNNAAYFLTENLNRSADAVPYAEKAAGLNPNHPGIVDTLAATYWAVGRKDEAIQKLTDSLRLSRTDVDKATYAIKLAGWKLQAGDAKGAASLANSVRELLIENPSALTAETSPKWEQLQKDLPAAR